MDSENTGTLFVCAVPIGNLDDVSVHLRRVLESVDVIACEDTRNTGKLLSLIGISAKARLLSYHDINEHHSSDGIVSLLSNGQNVALVSDAGTPGICDPGAMLVDKALNHCIHVEPVAGPSAISSAISVAGIAANSFTFIGFWPRRNTEVLKLIRKHNHEFIVGFESPNRVVSTVEVIANVQPQRFLVICRELTKLHGEILRGSAKHVSKLLSMREKVRGEIVICLGPNKLTDVLPDPKAFELVNELVENGIRLKRATVIAAKYLGGSAREMYDAVNALGSNDIE